MNRKRKNFKLSAEATQKILESMQEGLVVCNSNNTIEILNDAALKMLGIDDEMTVVGMPIKFLFYTEGAAVTFLTRLETEESIDHQELSLKKNDEQITCSVSATVVWDNDVADKLKVFVLHDISERKKTEQKLADYASRLEKSNKELDQFAYIVSHDLKAPLRAIINLSQWLQEDLDATLSEDNRRNLEMLKTRTFRMEALITGILEYSKIGRTKVAPESINVGNLIQDVLDSLLIPSHFTIEVSDMPTILTQRISLYQVFSNLISNAIKYNDKTQGHIKMGYTENSRNYIFSVEDNGPGIGKEFHDKIFIIFQTLQSRDKVESTGIGLTIVKRIIEEQSGKVWVESEVGKGTKFIFQLPKTRVN